MRTFKDAEGLEWKIEVEVTAIKRVRDLTGTDLLGVLDGALIQTFITDPVLLCDVLYALCKPQADERNKSDEDFGRAMRGDAIDAATKALLEEIVNFSPSPRDRANLGRVLELTWQTMEKARDKVEAQFGNGEIEKIVEQALEKLGSSSTTAPESPASIPAG